MITVTASRSVVGVAVERVEVSSQPLHPPICTQSGEGGRVPVALGQEVAAKQRSSQRPDRICGLGHLWATQRGSEINPVMLTLIVVASPVVAR